MINTLEYQGQLMASSTTLSLMAAVFISSMYLGVVKQNVRQALLLLCIAIGIMAAIPNSMAEYRMTGEAVNTNSKLRQIYDR